MLRATKTQECRFSSPSTYEGLFATSGPHCSHLYRANVGTLQIEKVCPRRDSNPQSWAGVGSKVRCVCQFRHGGHFSACPLGFEGADTKPPRGHQWATSCKLPLSQARRSAAELLARLQQTSAVGIQQSLIHTAQTSHVGWSFSPPDVCRGHGSGFLLKQFAPARV